VWSLAKAQPKKTSVGLSGAGMSEVMSGGGAR
jgi:hypothetical protein